MTLSRPGYPVFHRLCRGLFGVVFLSLSTPGASLGNECREQVTGQIRLEPHHPWRPPFDLERIGQGLGGQSRTPVRGTTAPGILAVFIFSRAKESSARSSRWLEFLPSRPSLGKHPSPNRSMSWRSLPNASLKELQLRSCVRRFSFPSSKLQAVARPEKLINPVDLGAILPPYDWLLLAGGQKTSVELAAISYRKEKRSIRVLAWFESDPKAQDRTCPGTREQQEGAINAASAFGNDFVRRRIHCMSL